MISYVLRRTLHSVLVLVGVLIIVFLMVQAIGDPARLMLPPSAPEQLYLDLRASMGLDRPLWQRLIETLGGWLRGDFGVSMWQAVPALPLALSRLPGTLFLAVSALAIAVPIALLVSILSAVRPGSAADKSVSGLSLLGVSVPDFWLALMLILVVGIQFRLLPTSGYGGIEFVILPALALALRPAGRIAQISRASLLEEMDKPYILAVRAKGLSRRQVVTRHGLKNSSLPMVTVLGIELAALMNGAVVVETIFAWNGIGALFIDAIKQRDLPLITACVFVITVMTILINLVVDSTYAFLDPRTKARA